jgi:purine nucleosidase
MTRTFLIDTDTASDDAVALIMALRSREVRVAAITVVAGNVDVSQATRNALYAAELCGSDVPIFSGAEKPLVRPLINASWFHGMDGLGDHGYAPKTRRAESLDAVDALIQTVLAHPGIEMVTLGPLTNVALAISREPRITEHVKRCVVMGGAPCCEGNITPAAEFNIFVDPEAARAVFHSGMPIEMVGWQLSRGEAVLNQSDINRVLALDNPLAEFAIRCNDTALKGYFKQTGERGISLPDPVAMSIALNPALCTESSEHHLEVETSSELTRGMTIVDRLNASADPRNQETWSTALKKRKTRICWTLDIPGWKAALFSAFRGT